MYFFTVLDEITQSADGSICLNTSGARGFSEDLTQVQDWIHNNIDDLYDGEYCYAIIEKVEQGINEPVTWRQLFKFDENKNGYTEIDEPDFIKKYEMSLIF